ncbi:hypothetical protein DFH27DRAFT_483513 [Peziza echinospora]|nr:hypothetical protein DFH27DRAFT_483513 [Peziza echinospora]
MPSSTSDYLDAGSQHGGKRVKLEHEQQQPQHQLHGQQQQPQYHQQQQQQQQQQHQPLLSFFGDSSLDYSGFNTPSNLHLQAPHISLEKASEQPGSPLTVTTTLSQYSTPSRSPTRVSILSESAHPDWQLFDESMGSTLTQDLPKERTSSTLHSHQPPHSSSNTSSSTPISSQNQLRNTYPYQMNTTAINGQYYAGFPIPDFTKLVHHPVLNPYGPTAYSGLSHHDEDLPALSPSTRYQGSSHQSACEELRSPMTPIGSPTSNDGDRAPNARTSAPHIHNPVPKFTRTVSDAVEDELFRSSPLDTSKPQKMQNSPLSPSLATYFQQAQKDHLLDSRNTAPHGFVGREKSPFRANSPFHPTKTPQGVQATPADQITSTPKTISPKDALLDYPEPEDDASKMSLFSHEQQYGNGNGNNHQQHSHSNTHFQSTDMGDGNESEISYDSGSRRGSEAESISSIGAFSYHHSPLLQSSLPFPFQTLGSSTEAGSTSLQEKDNQPQSPSSSKPDGSKADTGAYTCTAPGCQQRFPSPAKLQKHRRENHRHSSPAGQAGMTSTLQGVNRLQGPHRCARINPTTGKPCNTIFSRPYDLTRHEDTIHNTAREKVRCEICNDEKTFSRQDALTRHKKVKHGIDK